MRNWYVLRVQSGREDTIAENLLRKAEVKGLRDKLLQVYIPKEKRRDRRTNRVKEVKKFPGYVMVEVETDEEGRIPQDLWFLIRETPGISNFLGSGGQRNSPIPMDPEEVEKMLLEESEKQVEAPIPVKMDIQKGDRVRIKEGPFANFDGVVEEVFPQKGLVRVIVTIFGRNTPVDLEYWEIETIQ